MADERPHLLVVEDEAHLASGLKLNFELEGYDIDLATSVREAGKLLLQGSYDLIILDIMLPDGDGFDICKRLRDAGNFTPVLMLTARGTAADRILGLDAGADDYLPKPFELSELIARVRSLLRRRQWDATGDSEPPGDNPTLSFGDAHIDFRTHVVTVHGEAKKLTQLELDLLQYFAKHDGEVLGREELLERVWKLRNYPNTRTVDNFIVRLRKLFEKDPERPVHFVSHRGAGYRFVRKP